MVPLDRYNSQKIMVNAKQCPGARNFSKVGSESWLVELCSPTHAVAMGNSKERGREMGGRVGRPSKLLNYFVLVLSYWLVGLC